MNKHRNVGRLDGSGAADRVAILKNGKLIVDGTVDSLKGSEKVVEAIFDLPALTARDANSDALFDLFDFSCGRDMTPPPGAPAPGAGGCRR